jgi:hypothetical protein
LDPEYSPDWPSDLVDESEEESEAEEFDLANEDGMKSKPGSDIDVDSDIEEEEEDQAFSLATHGLNISKFSVKKTGEKYPLFYTLFFTE